MNELLSQRRTFISVVKLTVSIAGGDISSLGGDLFLPFESIFSSSSSEPNGSVSSRLVISIGLSLPFTTSFPGEKIFEPFKRFLIVGDFWLFGSIMRLDRCNSSCCLMSWRLALMSLFADSESLLKLPIT